MVFLKFGISSPEKSFINSPNFCQKFVPTLSMYHHRCFRFRCFGSECISLHVTNNHCSRWNLDCPQPTCDTIQNFGQEPTYFRFTLSEIMGFVKWNEMEENRYLNTRHE